MDLRRLRPVDLTTGFFGAALIGLLWAPWYSVPHAGFLTTVAPHWKGGTAWQAMTVDDIIFLIAGALALALVLFTVLYSTVAVPVATVVFVVWIGLLAAVLAIIRLIWPPDLGPGPTGREAGVWLGAAAAIGLAVSALVNMRGERRAKPGSYKLDISELPAPRVREEGSGA